MATVVTIDKLSVGAGAALAFALETISATTVLVWLKVGPEFGKVTLAFRMGLLLTDPNPNPNPNPNPKPKPNPKQVTLAFQLGLLLSFTPLLVFVQNFGWPLSLMLSSVTVIAVGSTLSVAMVSGGMATGFRAILGLGVGLGLALTLTLNLTR